MLVEPCALHAMVFLLYIGSWGAHSALQFTFFPILVEVQVRVVAVPSLRISSLGSGYLMMAINRLSPHSLSFCGSPTEARSRAILPSLGLSVQFISGVKKIQRA